MLIYLIPRIYVAYYVIKAENLAFHFKIHSIILLRLLLFQFDSFVNCLSLFITISDSFNYLPLITKGFPRIIVTEIFHRKTTKIYTI